MDAYREQFLTQNRFETTVVVEPTDTSSATSCSRSRTPGPRPRSPTARRARRPSSVGSWTPNTHGRGYATEAVRALLDIAFDGLGLRRVTAACFADNDASWRLMERVGMRRETYTVRDAHRSGDWLDGMVYALLADEHRPHTPPAAAVGHSTTTV